MATAPPPPTSCSGAGFHCVGRAGKASTSGRTHMSRVHPDGVSWQVAGCMPRPSPQPAVAAASPRALFGRMAQSTPRACAQSAAWMGRGDCMAMWLALAVGACKAGCGPCLSTGEREPSTACPMGCTRLLKDSCMFVFFERTLASGLSFEARAASCTAR